MVAQTRGRSGISLLTPTSSECGCYRNIEVLGFDSLAATEISKTPVLNNYRAMDLKIAAIALSLNATLLSRNLKDFSKVPRLKVISLIHFHLRTTPTPI
ncbi:MAG: type II toxin-antitoxin system VapC family toxin [Chloracidobacterium sp.]|nr:type II toxin-antitoxin system VapC family toxin [Chloracidobacterium sp.]